MGARFKFQPWAGLSGNMVVAVNRSESLLIKGADHLCLTVT